MSEDPAARRLPYGRQWIDESDVAAVIEALRGDFLTTGPTVGRFEDSLCAATGAKHAIAVNSGTSALHAAYFAAGIGPGDEIITSPMTFAATANAALYLGATVRFVDVSADTANLEPGAIEAAITSRTRAIVPVDFAGHPADYDPITAIAGRRGLRVIADAAHSLGATYRGRRVGTLADLTELSFHPVKPITTAEGGAVTTSDAGLATRAASFRSHGIVREPAALERDEGPWYYEQHDLGCNYRLTDIQCALGVSQMRKLAAFIDRRRAIAARYLRALAGISGIRVPVARPEVEHGWHLFVIRVEDPRRRRAFFERLRQLGLGVQVHYLPVYLHPFYRRLGFAPGSCPIAEDIYARSVSLPIYPRMDDDDVDSAVQRVAQAARELL